jgi:hypothetical protein
VTKPTYCRGGRLAAHRLGRGRSRDLYAVFMVGHRPIDPATGAATAAAGQSQVSVESAVAALDPQRWELVVAEERSRLVAATGVDAVIRARRLS